MVGISILGNQRFCLSVCFFFNSFWSCPCLFFPPFYLAVNGKQNRGLIEQIINFTYASYDTNSRVISFHLHKTHALRGCFLGMSDSLLFSLLGDSIFQP